MTAAPPTQPGRRQGLLFSATVLAVVATLVAGVVVVARQPDSTPRAEAQQLQVGVDAPRLAIEGETVPVTISATGPDPLQLVELWAGSQMVDSLDFDGLETATSLTLHWAAFEPGRVSLQARAFDTQGRVGASNTTIVQIAPAPVAHVVDDPEGSSLAEIAEQEGVGPEVVADLDPAADPDETLEPGSIVFFPPLTPPDQPPQDDAGDVSIDDAVLRIGDPVDGVFLYLTFADQVLRVPADPSELIPGSGSVFDLSPFLPPLPEGDIAVEVWGRSGDRVALLANLVVAASDLLAPATDLVAFREIWPTDITVPVRSLTATDAETVELEWSSTVPHDGARWFLSTRKPGPAMALMPTGVLQSGLAEPQDGLRRFSIDLAANTTPRMRLAPIFSSPISEPTADTVTGTDGTGLPDFSVLPRLDPPGTTWAWVVPVDAAGQPVGPPSQPVRIIITEAPFDPSDAPPFDVLSIEVVVPPAPNQALANCVRIVSQTPPFPTGVGVGFYLNPDGSTVLRGSGGTKITGTLPYTLDQMGRALYPFTACPGERGNFQWGSVGCGADPFCHISKGLADLGAAAQAFANFLVDLTNYVADAYNELKAWAIAQVASAICPSAVSGPCKTMIEIAVDALLTSVGVPPTMPNFNDLAEVAKGELIDLAMDQLGVGSVCDAVAQAGTGKSCGELATELQNLDACSFAPKGQEDKCRNLVDLAKNVCEFTTDRDECALLTTNAQALIEEGLEVAVDQSIEAIKAQVSRASMASLGFFIPTYGEHHCGWGGPNRDQVICPPQKSAELPVPGLPGTVQVYETPPGCHIGSSGQDSGKVVCSYPPGEIVAVPEPLGTRQPMEVKVRLARNDNPLPDDFACGPIYATATTITPRGAIGQPYLPASSAFPSENRFLPGFYGQSVWLSEPNPHVEIPDDKKPPPATGLIEDAITAALIEEAATALSGPRPTNEWKYLLEEGSFVSIVVYGQCIPKTYGEGAYGVVGVIPPPQPRIMPGEP
jgi:hypothetical protein